MNFILVAIWLSSITGAPLSYERIQSFPSAEACLQAQLAQPIHTAQGGKVETTVCVREDQMHERST